MNMGTKIVESSHNTLQFTGNWFIDAGILGFVNLMEEVYGWDLEELRKRIRENKELIYYGYFPFAYLFYHSRIRTVRSEISGIRKKITDPKKGLRVKLRESEKKLRDLINESKKIKSNEKPSKLKSQDKKIEKENKKITQFKNEIIQCNNEISNKEKNLIKELDEFKQNIENKIFGILVNVEEKKEDIKSLIHSCDLKLPKDHRNFFIYNPKKDLYTSFVYLWYLLKEDYSNLRKFASKISEKKKKDGLTYEIRADSTINPFLYSPGEFPNIGYTDLPKVIMVEEWLNVKQPLYLLLLSFGNSFQFIEGRNLMFYTNLLESSYEINKKFALYKERKGRRTDMFKITWTAIIDTIIEKKVDFSLENMYIIEFGGIENLKLKDVEFIGIPKLRASIVLDDRIRDAMNKRIQVGPKYLKGDKYVWLLKEFIKGKPLYPLVLQHVKVSIDESRYPNYSVFYALLIEAVILEFKEKNSSLLFSQIFFSENYREMVTQVKRTFPSTFYYSTQETKRLIPDLKMREKIAYLLLDSLYANDKAGFLIVLLKSLNNRKEIINKGFLNWVFNKIVDNELSWPRYALCLTAGLVYR